MTKIIKTPGSTQKVWGFFFDPDTNDPTDPITLSIDVRIPDGTTVHKSYPDDAEIERDSEGRYLYRLYLALEGTYHWRWNAGGGPGISVTVTGELDSVETPSF